MPAYANLSGKSGVVAYELGAESIIVTFKGGARYTYTDQSCGADVVGLMKLLARAGKGLSTYVAKNRPAYARKA